MIKKTTLLVLSFSLISFVMNAQFEVKRIDGTPFTNGEVIEFTSYGNTTAELKFLVYNNATQNLDFRIRCMDLVNATGTNFQLCWGYECIPDVAVGGTYPNYQNIINAGGSTFGLGDSFKNFNAGDGANYPMDHTFRFLTRDLNGANVGSTFNITYRYQGPLSIDQKDKLNAMGIKVLNTQVDNFIGLEISKKIDFELINLQGQIINKGVLENNTNLDMTSTQTGVYILNFQNEEGLTDSVKIYKK